MKSCFSYLKIFFFGYVTVLSTEQTFSQPNNKTPPTYYNIVRYNDRDFSFLRTDTSDHDLFNALKYIPLSPKGTDYITLGGEVREEYRYLQNENWGDILPERIDPDGFLWHRFMFHADVHLGKYFRLFGQVKNCLVASRAGGVRPVIDEDVFDLNQAFIEVSGAFAQNQVLTLRLGRQEFNYGAARLLTMREGPNVRQAFDAFSLKYATPRIKADAFIGQGVDTKRGVFDDERLKSETIWGLYTTFLLDERTDGRTTSADAYYMGFSRDSWKYAGVQGVENRHSFGGRINSRAKEGLNYEAEATYQLGTFAYQSISAYQFAGSVNYLFNIPLQPALGLGWSIASGDQTPNDGISNSFSSLYSKPLCTQGLAIASTNISMIQPFLNLAIVPQFQIQLTAYLLMLTSANDGLYAVTTAQTRTAPALKNAPDKRAIGNQYSCFLTWILSRHLRLFTEATLFTAGEYVKLTGVGRDMLYGSAQLQFTF
jgi:Alginate export